MYQHVLAAEPMHADALHLLGVLALQNRPARSGGRVDRPRDCHQAGGGFLRASRARAGEPGKAERSHHLLSTGVATQPGIPGGHCNLGSALKQAGQVTEAIAAYRSALDLRPEFPEAFNNLGLALRDADRLPEAITAFSRATVLRPQDAEAWNNLGSALNSAGDSREALRALGRAIAIRPDFADAHNNMGSAHKRLGDVNGAIGEFQQAIAIQPNFPEALNNIAMIFQERGQRDEAVGLYRKALALKADFAPAHLNLALALREKGELDEAIACCRRAVALSRDLPKRAIRWACSCRLRALCPRLLRRSGRRSRRKPATPRRTAISPTFFGKPVAPPTQSGCTPGHRVAPRLRRGAQQPRPRATAGRRYARSHCGI